MTGGRGQTVIQSQSQHVRKPPPSLLPKRHHPPRAPRPHTLAGPVPSSMQFRSCKCLRFSPAIQRVACDLRRCEGSLLAAPHGPGRGQRASTAHFLTSRSSLPTPASVPDPLRRGACLIIKHQPPEGKCECPGQEDAHDVYQYPALHVIAWPQATCSGESVGTLRGIESHRVPVNQLCADHNNHAPCKRVALQWSFTSNCWHNPQTREGIGGNRSQAMNDSCPYI